MTTDPKQETVEERARALCQRNADSHGRSWTTREFQATLEALRSYGAEREAAGRAAGKELHDLDHKNAAARIAKLTQEVYEARAAGRREALEEAIYEFENDPHSRFDWSDETRKQADFYAAWLRRLASEESKAR